MRTRVSQASHGSTSCEHTADCESSSQAPAVQADCLTADVRTDMAEAAGQVVDAETGQSSVSIAGPLDATLYTAVAVAEARASEAGFRSVADLDTSGQTQPQQKHSRSPQPHSILQTMSLLCSLLHPRQHRLLQGSLMATCKQGLLSAWSQGFRAVLYR